MKLNFVKIKNFIKLKDLPEFFERYEVFVIAGGAIVAFLIAGLIFYNNAYEIVSTPPKASVDLPRINKFLFDKTLKELEAKKQPVSSEPIVDPFR